MPPSWLDPVTRESLSSFCNLLYDRHLVVGAGGNVAARHGPAFLTTPTGLSLRDIRPEHLLDVGPDGKCLSDGDLQPSKELRMHLAIFQERPDAQVVCHVHGSYITALSCLFDPGPDTLPPLCPGHVYYARPLPLLPFYIPGTPELAQEVANAFAAEDVLALLLQNHGLITVGRTLAEAINIAEEIDEAAMVYLHTGGRGRRLGEDDVQTLMRQRRDAFGAGRSGSA